MTKLNRRHLIASGLAGIAAPGMGWSATAREITWEDLIPPGVPYAEIIGEGEMNEVTDTWRPIFDSNATKLNAALHGAYVRLPGFILPLELGAEGVTEFVLVPYVGACIHSPPPPPNQMVFVELRKEYEVQSLYDPVWITGQIRVEQASRSLTFVDGTNSVATGYALSGVSIEPYE